MLTDLAKTKQVAHFGMDPVCSGPDKWSDEGKVSFQSYKWKTLHQAGHGGTP